MQTKPPAPQTTLLKTLLLISLLAPCLFCESAAANAKEPASSEQERFFEQHVRPLLIKHCIECHGPQKQFAELRLDSRDSSLKGGESGPAIVPGQPEESLLLSAVRRESFEMPPDKPLQKEEIQILNTWIKQGAVWPASSNPAKETKTNFAAHWSFQPIQNPPRPEVQQADWPQNDLDYFILKKLEQNNLAPSPPAETATLRRRIIWDLTGLTPTSDTAAKTSQLNDIETLVEQQLASPHYGERWGRYWLDLARYADTKGYVFFEKPKFHNAFTYRDYVIHSFNEDKPFDQFILEQLAADQLDDHAAQAALGFITLGPRFKNDTHDIISDRIDVVTRGLLGLTVGCARCHHHKYDPISIDDYYSLYGVFRNSLEPIHLPFRDPDNIPKSLQPQAKQLEQNARELDQLYQRQYEAVLQGTYDRLTEYLTAAQSRRSGPDTVKFDVIVDGDDLNPEVLLKWQEFLDLTEKEKQPVFQIWHQLAAIPPQQFAAESPLFLRKTLQEKTTDPVQRRIARELLNKHPNRFSDVIATYVSLFKQLDQEWNNLIVEAPQPDQQKIPAPFPVENQKIREAFYSADSPLVMPRHGFTILKLFPDRKLQKKVKDLNAALDQARAKAPAELAQLRSLRDAEQMIEPRVFRRGNPGTPAQLVPRSYLSFFEEVSKKTFTQGSGRLELARAIISPQNPLTARVIVNRVWQHHFGQGIVSTPSDFGLQGARPSHPELLDHLAHWFMQNGWSIKKLHRYIMASATYQQQSISHAKGEKIDPANKLVWRMNRRRQDFETMRDSLLQVSHQLDETVGGKSVNGITAASNKRRTLYTSINRQQVPGVLRTFDFPSPDVSSGSRNSTSVPGQSLFLMNHPLVLNAARILGEEAEKAATPADGIRQLYQQILNRTPTQTEQTEMQAFLEADKIPTPEVPTPIQWEYGYGAFDLKTNQLSQFTPIPFWNGQQYQGSETLPDPKIGWVFLDKTGGHPGNDLNHVAVIRWRAPRNMQVSLKARFQHKMPQGNGVRGRILIADQLKLGPWTIHQKSVDTNLDQVRLKQGQTIDFVVDIADHLGYDSFIWAPEISEQPEKIASTSQTNAAEKALPTWNYTRDFRKPERMRISSWQSLAQILLLSNEFQFID